MSRVRRSSPIAWKDSKSRQPADFEQHGPAEARPQKSGRLSVRHKPPIAPAGKDLRKPLNHIAANIIRARAVNERKQKAAIYRLFIVRPND